MFYKDNEMKFNYILGILYLLVVPFYGHTQSYSHADSLRGGNTKERSWWNVKHYDLHVLVNPKDSTIVGSNTIIYSVLKSDSILQIDLQKPMKIDEIIQGGKRISYIKDGAAHFIQLEATQVEGEIDSLIIYFSGKPRVAKKPPWDGGIVWTNDSLGNSWVANANQGIGASIWWPLKDFPADEPDNGMVISVTVPKGLMDVSNGVLKAVKPHSTTTTWVWEVQSPINPYGINISIGNYTYWKETFNGKKGKLQLSFYCLKNHKEMAEKQFQQVKKMLKAFEYWFGPYPFYKDGYKIVEVPYLGMEHQSSITYGNHFKNGYLGRDLSKTGWGLKFDFIIIHESGHEWFANNITAKDVADLWIHEGFTCYSESLFLEYYYGKKAGSEYVIGLRKLIKNNRPLIGNYGVNDQVTEDVYWKGANILNTLRYWINDDTLWRSVLSGLNQEFYHTTVTTKQIEDYIAQKTNLNLSTFWEQYLRTTQIPVLEYKIENNSLLFRYQNCVNHFNLPVDVFINQESHRLFPSKYWKKLNVDSAINGFTINPNYYIIPKINRK